MEFLYVYKEVSVCTWKASDWILKAHARRARTEVDERGDDVPPAPGAVHLTVVVVVVMAVVVVLQRVARELPPRGRARRTRRRRHRRAPSLLLPLLLLLLQSPCHRRRRARRRRRVLLRRQLLLLRLRWLVVGEVVGEVLRRRGVRVGVGIGLLLLVLLLVVVVVVPRLHPLIVEADLRVLPQQHRRVRGREHEEVHTVVLVQPRLRRDFRGRHLRPERQHDILEGHVAVLWDGDGMGWWRGQGLAYVHFYYAGHFGVLLPIHLHTYTSPQYAPVRDAGVLEEAEAVDELEEELAGAPLRKPAVARGPP